MTFTLLGVGRAGGVLGAREGAAGGAGIGGDAGVPGTVTPAMLESGAHPAAPSCHARSVGENVPSASFRLTSSSEYCPSCCPFRATCICMVVLVTERPPQRKPFVLLYNLEIRISKSETNSNYQRRKMT
jgi:hypothetical protein